MTSDLNQLYALIADIEVAMLTTRRADGHLESRPMATQKHAPGADLWFVAREGTAKLKDIEADPHINLAYYEQKTWEWISVSGTAVPSRDPQTIHQLYAPDWKAWFAEDGDPRHGTAEDPRIVLIGVTVHAAVFMEVNKPRPVVLYEMLKGWLTGQEPEIGQIHVIDEAQRRG